MGVNLKIGDSYVYERLVTPADLASSLESGTEEVFSTPAMVLWFEIAATKLLGELEPQETSVGIEINTKHLAATPSGLKVKIVANLVDISGKIYTFELEAFDEFEKIGECVHKRAIINRERFLQKTLSKRK